LSVEHRRSVFTHVTAPGETVASPVVFVGPFEGSLDEATHLTRTLATRHYIPPRPSIRVPVGAEFPYVMADTWGYGPNIDEAGLRAFIDRAAEVGVEGVTIDEGWEQRIGDWLSHPTRFPSGLRATVDYIHAKGMAAGLWFAFGNVDLQSQVALAHPDWLATQGGAPVVGSFDANVLCLSHPEARAWVASEFDRIIGEFDVEWFVQDFETIARCDNPAHAPWHQAGDSEFRNVQALWELIAGARARHPNVMLENNWSGARVMDFGMLKLYDAALCDDYNLAARNRLASFGVTHFFPPAFTSKYMGAETDPTLPFDYRTRSHFFGGPWNLMIDLPAQNAAELAGAVSAYKRLRAIIRDGRVYHLKAPSMWGVGAYRHQVDWDAIQALASGARQATVLVGRGSGGPDAFNVKPRGLIPDVVYSAESSSGASYAQRSGADLMASGIDVSLPERSHETIILDAD
ncbi:MAG TPA: glycoside hydrolase family 36 protein, partial [Anaerolineae bacterium]|nr:glycoside hydrolase family 36 protein [Anaerolineae bacterium]